ncbi:MAG: putative addiction module antidote protein [Deltaproteobacteria bacterium]|jgi:probable addiction module antidote protein|nr:putative addiction module antidote protein [Deltaproteobacteria bacterium]
MKKVYITDRDINKLVKFLNNNEISKFIVLLGQFAKIYGMTKLASECGRNRESLYKVFSTDSKPKFNTILDILNCFGLKITIYNLNNNKKFKNTRSKDKI